MAIIDFVLPLWVWCHHLKWLTWFPDISSNFEFEYNMLLEDKTNIALKQNDDILTQHE